MAKHDGPGGTTVEKPHDLDEAVALSDEMAAALDDLRSAAIAELPESHLKDAYLQERLADGGFVVEPQASEERLLGQVTNRDGDAVPFGTDLVVIMALDEAWAAKKAEWLAALSGLSPVKTLSKAMMMVEAIKGVDY